MLKGYKILITGAGGFIGAYFLDKLKDENVVISLLRRDPSEYWRLNLFEKNYKVYKVDIAQRDKVFNIFSKEKPDIVLHFASGGTYPSISKDIYDMFSSNIFGSINVIDAAISFSDLLVMTGSSSEYGNVKCPMKEDGPTSPTIYYGATKLFATHYGRIKARNEKKKLIIIRPFSVYGIYEEPIRLIPSLLSAILLNKKIKLSSPTNVRDYVFIDDFYRATLGLIKKSDIINYGEIFNIGSGKETSIRQLLDLLEKKVVCKNIEVEWGKEITQPEPKHWYADTTKLNKIGIRLSYKLEDGLKTTIEWIKKNIMYYAGEKKNEN